MSTTPSRAILKTATSAVPITPGPQTASTPSSEPTGSWRHPRLDEIARRKYAATFTDRNLKYIAWNTAFFIASFVVSAMTQHLPKIGPLTEVFSQYSDWIYGLFRLLMVYNVVIAAMPLFAAPDDLSDIPLTPGQRKLLGLPPSSSKHTPETKFITPPRYPRSSSGKISSPLASPSGSPASRLGSESPVMGTPRGSPFQSGSPYQNGSPLIQKAMGGGGNGNRRHSYGSPSPLGPSLSRVSGFEVQGTPSSPSPAAAKNASVGLNNRYLYDKSRLSGGNASRLFS